MSMEMAYASAIDDCECCLGPVRGGSGQRSADPGSGEGTEREYAHGQLRPILADDRRRACVAVVGGVSLFSLARSCAVARSAREAQGHRVQRGLAVLQLGVSL